MATIKEITSYADWDAHQASLPPTTLLLISFHAPWAAPCAQMATVLKTLAAEYPADGTTSWVSLNAEDLSDISEKYDVTAVPFLVLSKGGQVLETVSGSSAVKVRNAIEAHAGKPGAGAGTATATNGSSSVATANGKGDAMAVDEQVETDPARAKEELNKRLEELVKAAPVMLFMKGTPSAPQCGFSRQMVAMLRENSVKYGFFNILADDEVRQGLKEFADWPTYPQLWIDGELVGGLDIVSFAQASLREPKSSSLTRKLGQGGDREQPRLSQAVQREQLRTNAHRESRPEQFSERQTQAGTAQGRCIISHQKTTDAILRRSASAKTAGCWTSMLDIFQVRSIDVLEHDLFLPDKTGNERQNLSTAEPHRVTHRNKNSS